MPSYRVVVIDSKKRRDGRPLEEIGFYNPLTEEATLDIEKIKIYQSNGAQASRIVQEIYVKAMKNKS